MSRELRRREAKAAKRKGAPRKVVGRMLPHHLTLAELAPILAVFANITGTILSGKVTNDEIGGFISHVMLARTVLEKQSKPIPSELDRAIQTICDVRHYRPVDEDDVLALDDAARIATAVILKTRDSMIRETSEALELRTYLNEEAMYSV